MNDQNLHFLDLVEILDDPRIETQQASRVYLEINMMLPELQSLPAAVATDYMATVIRATDVELNGMRVGLINKLHAIDRIQSDTTAGASDQMLLLRSIKAQTERIERFVAGGGVTGPDVATKHPIDAQAYYGYADAADLLGISVATLYRRKVEGRLRAVELGRRVKFLGRDLLRLRNDPGNEIHILQCE